MKNEFINWYLRLHGNEFTGKTIPVKYEGRSISKVNFPLNDATMNFEVYSQKLALFRQAYIKF